MGQKWLLKSEPNVWSIDQQKKLALKVLPGMESEITKQPKI